MDEPAKPKGRSFWSKVEDAGESMEMGFRLVLGLILACVFVSTAWWLGSQVWVGLAVILALPAFPLGFLVGFFWLEVKFLVRMVLGMIFHSP